MAVFATSKRILYIQIQYIDPTDLGKSALSPEFGRYVLMLE